MSDSLASSPPIVKHKSDGSYEFLGRDAYSESGTTLPTAEVGPAAHAGQRSAVAKGEKSRQETPCSIDEFLEQDTPAPRLTAPPVSELEATLARFVPAGQVTELRCLGVVDDPNAKYPPHVRSGFWDSGNHVALAKVAEAHSGISKGVYFVFNPVDPELMSTRANRVGRAKEGEATEDDDVLGRVRILIDSDSIKRSATTGKLMNKDCSATEAERDKSFYRLVAVIRFLMNEMGWPEPSEVCDSGNGFHAFWLIDLPADDGGLVARILKGLSVKFTNDDVKIDSTCSNASRITKFYSTKARKGENRPDRPHRYSGILWTSDRSKTLTQSFLEDTADRIAPEAAQRGESATASRSTSNHAARTNDPASNPVGGFSGDRESRAYRLHRATRYMETKESAISGQNGHGVTFDAACVLVKGFDLSPAESFPILADWNKGCLPPWEPRELQHKLDQADKKPDDKARGYLFDAGKPSGSRPSGSGVAVEAPDAEDADFSHVVVPQAMARVIKNTKYSLHGVSTIRKHSDVFYEWKDGAYALISAECIKDMVSVFAQSEVMKEFNYQGMAFGMKQQRGEAVDEKSRPKERALARGFVADVVQAWGAQVRNPTKDCPAWLDGDGQDWPAVEVIAFPNALVHAPSYGTGRPCSRKPTPRFFGTSVVGYQFDENAPKSIRWLEFLGAVPIAKGSPIKHQLWREDPESIDTLQEWMGLQLVPVTKFQKILAMIGPTRSGKGTILRLMQKMVGKANCVGTTFSKLEQEFGAQSMIGKLCAIIDDARLSPRSNLPAIAEFLLSLSGEGTFAVNRKHISDWEGKLTARLTIASNELPRLPDNSGALATRFLILRFNKSFKGEENAELDDIVQAELPGILLWALEGLARLMARAKFIQPESGVDLHEDMEDLASPIGAFVKQCCNVGEGESIEKEALYSAWKAWCEANGKKEAGELITFSRNLRTVVPGMKATRPRKDGDRVHMFKGVGLPSDNTSQPSEEAETPILDWDGIPLTY